ncbi:MAG: FAD-dependent oxidoreductase [Clostridia bacterium]|nr:FAD-dependent oxidoreductase [Clostridia bacterium]
MIQTISSIRLNIGENDAILKEKACKIAKISPSKIKYFKIVKKSLDARKKNDIHFVCSVVIGDEIEKEPPIIKEEFNHPKKPTVIIGSGPAGLFSALILARKGFKPIVIERGGDVENRKKSIDDFINTRILDKNSNVQFGEGGAGTFSDGKLNTGVKSPFSTFVLNEFVKHGANEEILYLNKPHVGSDVLPKVVKSIREEIISLGGQYMFDTVFYDLTIKNGAVSEIFLEKDGKKFSLEVENLILAIGHSSRDTYKMLYNRGFSMETKDTAVGFRIEHLQDDINKAQYGNNYDKRLPVADYKLTSNICSRGVFTFCMCPGGFVMPATSEENAVVTNGMSNFLRDGKNANSAVVVQVKKEDYPSGIIEAIDYIENFEKKAFVLANSDYSAPCQLVGDFLKGKISTGFKKVKPTYPLGVKFCDLSKIYPKIYIDCIKKSLIDMGKRLNVFDADDAILTAPCTRTSSPVRIVRGENLSSINIINAYPAGETGYAGGIMSSAIDGIRVANTISEKYLIKSN